MARQIRRDHHHQSASFRLGVNIRCCSIKAAALRRPSSVSLAASSCSRLRRRNSSTSIHGTGGASACRGSVAGRAMASSSVCGAALCPASADRPIATRNAISISPSFVGICPTSCASIASTICGSSAASSLRASHSKARRAPSSKSVKFSFWSATGFPVVSQFAKSAGISGLDHA